LHKLILKAKYTLKEEISDTAKDLLKKLLDPNPKTRYSVAKTLEHPWFADLDETLLTFNEIEREVIKKEFSYNDPSRYNRNEVVDKDVEPWDCFTELNLDSMN
jgi:serine/threonine protein kinase